MPPVEGAPTSVAADDTARSFSQGVEDITNLLNGPDDPAPEEGEDQEANIDAEADDEPGPDDVEASADDSDEEEDGPGYTKGKFASDDAKVTLKDGTALSVAELKRGYLAQRDYSRQTQEVKTERDAVKSDRARMNEIAQALVAQRDFLLQYAEKKAPKAPPRDMLETDPIGYWRAKAEYDDDLTEYNTLQAHRQAETQRLQEEAEDALKTTKSEEARKLFAAIPEFRKPEVYNKFWADAQQVMSEHYGISPEELADTYDHRMYKAMKDLVKYHKAKVAAPEVKEQLQKKPQFIKGGQRQDPKKQISREAKGRAERLAKTGSFEAGIASLMDIPNL